MLADDPARAADFALREGSLYFNFARQSYDREALQALLAVARAQAMPEAFRRLFDGEEVNVTEGRASLHTALRGDHSGAAIAREACATASAVRERMAALITQLQASDITDIVSVGIGGSDLGPRLVADALRAPEGGRFRVHFLSNVDGAATQRTLAPLDPARTAAILIQKPSVPRKPCSTAASCATGWAAANSRRCTRAPASCRWIWSARSTTTIHMRRTTSR